LITLNDHLCGNTFGKAAGKLFVIVHEYYFTPRIFFVSRRGRKGHRGIFNTQNGLLFATENTDIHGKITNGNHEERSEGIFLCFFGFIRVFPCIPWLKNISFDTLSQYFLKISACSVSSARNLFVFFVVKNDRERL